MDSVIAWFYESCNWGLKPEQKESITPVYCALGHRYQQYELDSLGKLEAVLKKHSKLPKFDLKVSRALEKYGEKHEQEDANIPARNLLLAVEAANFGATRVIIVCQKDERTLPDRDANFFSSTSALLSHLFSKRVWLEPIFNEMDKTEMVVWFLNTPKLPLTRQERIEILSATVACYTPAHRAVGLVNTKSDWLACGECPACFRRAVALAHELVFEDHAVNVFETKTVDDYISKMASYSPLRRARILRALYLSGSSRHAQATEKHLELCKDDM
jgi:7-cyano-7-deazaguanine synthase in queuosine biosynthesis